MGQHSIPDRLFTLRDVSIRYLVIPKCACTYIKNILWHIETGSPYYNPQRIHDVDNLFLRASDFDLSTRDISHEEFAFTVIRNPVDRFISLYTDKILGNGHKDFVPLRDVLSTKYGLNMAPQTSGDHKKNCDLLIEWIGQNLDSKVDMDVDPHWAPQCNRKLVLQSCRLKLLLVNKLNSQLRILLQSVVPNIEKIMQGAERNKSYRHFAKKDILSTQLRKKINYVYQSDRELFIFARQAWSKIGESESAYKRIPRFPD